ncbi:MAG: D-alanyl-D-alanine carboxypeptidase/D-alanyl-D-alanine-endopeptidase [Propionicimonas sp.]
MPQSRRSLRAGLTCLVAGSLLAVTGCSAPPTPEPPAATPTSTQVVASTSPTASPAPLPDPAALKARLDKVSRSGIGVSGIVVMDGASGDTLLSRGDKALVPASSLKVLTAVAALDVMGAGRRFTTRVVTSSPGSLVLVGGGDPLLTDKQSTSAAKPASLQALAAATVSALKSAGTKRVTLAYDTSLFSGPGWNRHWKPAWRTFTPQVTALMSNRGQLNKWQAYPNPAATAAKAFAARLAKAGIKVTTVKAAKAPAGAATVAEAPSAPLARIVEHTLRYSDNIAAEVLSRQFALASGKPASFAGAKQALQSWLAGHGLWGKGMVLDDGSGLSTANLVRPSALAGAVRLALTTPDLQAVADGLPVAGKNGTLKDRFDDASEKSGRGVVHAKTGTLQRVSSLTGYLTTADGATLVFSAIANRTSGQTTAYNWLDRTAAALARCGCR